MKKRILLTGAVCAMCIMCGCAKPETSNKTESTKVDKKQEETVTIPEVTEKETQTEAVPGNPNPVKKLSFYKKDKSIGKRVLVTGYEGPFTQGLDIAEYEVFPTDLVEISAAYYKTVWNQYWSQYEGAEEFKLGYEINFSLKDGTSIHKTIKSPKDTESFFEYIEVYMYDDTNIPEGQWYSHVTEDQMNATTMLTSIKLTAGKGIANVGDTITVTVFAYKDANDFDAVTGYYIGRASKTITYKRG